MKPVASFQHDPLSRQCSVAIHIKSIDPKKHINNKKEYHQPGEVEIRYEKNINLNKTNNKSSQNDKVLSQKNINTTTEKGIEEKTTDNNQRTIKDFFKILEKEVNLNDTTNNQNEEETISSQEMVEDARARRHNKNAKFSCDNCEYSTRSVSLLKKT